MKKTASLSNKVTIGAGKGMALKSQSPAGKLPGAMKAMPGSPGLGQMIKTIPSNAPAGPVKRDTAMGNGGVIDGFV